MGRVCRCDVLFIHTVSRQGQSLSISNIVELQCKFKRQKTWNIPIERKQHCPRTTKLLGFFHVLVTKHYGVIVNTLSETIAARVPCFSDE